MPKAASRYRGELVEELGRTEDQMDAARLRFRARNVYDLDPDALAMYVDGTATEDFDTDEFLRRISCPALLMRGDPGLGGAIEDKDEQRAKSLLPQLAVVRLSGVGHGIHNVKPVEFLRIASDFLESL